MKPGEGLARVAAACFELKDHVGAELICKEQRSKIIFTKPSGRLASKIKIDGCHVKNDTACDYLIHDWQDRYHFVELKGRKIEKAFEQLEASIPLFLPSGTKAEFWCFVICTKSTPYVSTKRQRLEARLKQKWSGAKFTVRGPVHIHPLTD